jgi:hypothetical protein
MKVLLDISENKAYHLMEVLKGLSYVKTKKLTEEKAEILSDIKDAVDEINEINNDKIFARNVEEFLNEL